MIPFLIYLAGFLYVLYILKNDKDLQMTALTSFLFNEEFAESNKGTLSFLYSLVWPVTIFFILRLRKVPSIKLNIMRIIKNVIAFVVLIVILWGAFYLVSNEISYYNQSVNIEQTFNQQKNARLVVLDKITKIIQQKLQVSGIVDSSYYKNLKAITVMRTDGPAVMWKWLTENNPNQNYSEVSKLYQQVMDAISQHRQELAAVESELQETTKAYALLHKQWPSSWYLWYQSSELPYKAISTTHNLEVNNSGIDDSIRLH